MSKQFIKEQQLLEDSFRLALSIYNSGCRPSVIVGLWRGGSTVGIYVQEALQHLGVDTRHIAVRTSYEGAPSYQEMVNDKDNIQVHGLQYLYDTLNYEDSLLIVDDVYNSGSNIEAVIQKLQTRIKANMPQELRVAALWVKPDNNQTSRKPDFFLHQTQDWLVLPYELTGLSEKELFEHKPFVREMIEDVKAALK
jgi:hypoxanthine phosphoribosyltransferase